MKCPKCGCSCGGEQDPLVLKKYVEELRDYFNKHINATDSGPSRPPSPPKKDK